MAGLIKKAKFGASPEVKLFMQLAGEYIETTRSELTGLNGEPIAMTLADLVTAAANTESDSDTDHSSPENMESRA